MPDDVIGLRIKTAAFRADVACVRQQFDTASGVIELVFDEETRIVSAHRFGANGRPVAAAMESWDEVSFAGVLTRQLGVSAHEAAQIEAVATAVAGGRPRRRARPYGSVRLSLRLVALLLRTVIVLCPLAILVGLFLLVVRR